MKSILVFIFLLVATFLPAQHYTISGKVIADKNDDPLVGAYVFLQYPWGEEVKATTTDVDGTFSMKNIEQGGYKLKVTFLGQQNLIQEVTIAKDVNLGTLRMKEGAVDLEGVDVTGKVPMAQQLEDTTQYNANAFKTLKDATAEELIEKMPGVTVDNGKVQAQGEDVKQVLVDGKPFFGNDPTAALRNLPAEIISKIQVYDQQSEQAQFSGFQDGETSKTINIITKPGMNNGQFGKMYAGYGYDHKYQLGGNTNFFDGNRRISIIGQSNNINIQNFSTDDLLGVVGSSGRGGRGGRGRGGRGRRGGRGGSSVNDFLINASGGIATTHALGLNYSDKLSKKVDVTGSYFVNWSDTDETELLNRTFLSARNSGDTYTEDNFSTSKNMNHRINMRWNVKLDSVNSLTIRPRLSLQMNDGESKTLGETISEGVLQNYSNNIYASDLSGMNFSNNLTWRRKLAKRGRTISLSAQTDYNDNKGESNQFALNGYNNATFVNDTLDQFSDLLTTGWNLSGRLSYTEPLGERSQLSINYRTSWQEEESDKKTYDFMELEEAYSDLNESQSSVFTNQYSTHQVGSGYRYSIGRNLNVMVRAFFQYANLQSDETFPETQQINRDYYSVLPMAMFRYRFSRESNLRFFYMARTQSPSVTQLQNVLDNSNPLSLSLGNPNLDQSLQHRFSFRYNKTNTEKATVFYIMAGGIYSNQYIGSSTYLRETDNVIFEDLDLLPGAQLSQPVNLDGYVALNSFMTYGIPLKAFKVNLNFDVNENYSRVPGLLNDDLNYANNNTIGVGITLSSNISDKVDFTISSRSNYNTVSNTLDRAADSKYWSQQSKLRFGWILPAGIVLRSEIAHQYYNGLGDDFNDDYLLWTAGIGKKIFKNQRGEITLSVFDLLNQNRKVTRNITDVYIEDVQTNVLQRYVMLKFQYTFLNYNTGKKAESRKEERHRRF